MNFPRAEKRRVSLEWPAETAGGDPPFFCWAQPDSNICLDFHGDPLNAQLVVFSDGNHHMALQESLAAFACENRGLSRIFYTTTPPGPLVKMVRSGGLRIGNLIIRMSPHLLISPPQVLDTLAAEGHVRSHTPFMRNRGSALLVRKGNPKNIFCVADLARKDLRLFLSNPETETVSHSGYLDTLRGMAAAKGVDLSPGEAIGAEIIYGQCVHHREAPQALADDCADAAILYYHLALRYIRIFPALFEMVPLGGTVADPRPAPENRISSTHAAIVGDGGRWGAELLRFLSSDAVRDIYADHGLLPAR